MLAGLGTAGVLVGAVAAVAALTAGVVAFNAWPGSPSAGQRAAVPLSGERGDAVARAAASARAALFSTATSRPTASLTAGTAASRGRSKTASSAHQPTSSARRGDGSAGATGVPSTAAVTQAKGVNTPQKERAGIVAGLADETGRQLAGGLKDGGDALASATRPVSTTAADAVTSLSDRVADAVTAATRALSDVLRTVRDNSKPPGS